MKISLHFYNWLHGHGIYNYLLQLHILYSLYLQQIPQLVRILYLEWAKPSFLKGLPH